MIAERTTGARNSTSTTYAASVAIINQADTRGGAKKSRHTQNTNPARNAVWTPDTENRCNPPTRRKASRTAGVKPFVSPSSMHCITPACSGGRARSKRSSTPRRQTINGRNRRERGAGSVSTVWKALAAHTLACAPIP